MEKISVTLDLSKIDKLKIVDRKYTDKAGVEHTAKEYKIDVVPLKAEKFVTEGSWGKMFKTHFVAQAQTKEERQNNAASVFVGDGFRFESANTPTSSPSVLPNYTEEEINPDDIPF